MILSDFHIHSSFSADCQEIMEKTIRHGINSGIKNLCFTEHHDIDMPFSQLLFLLDFDTYYNTFLRLKSTYADKINLFFGVELGIQPHIWADLSDVVKKYPFDFIICSQHVVNGKDPYSSNFYENKSKKTAYNEYFETVLNNVKNYFDYDVYGHLDYIIRYGPYENKNINYIEFQDILDEILKTIIYNGKGIEINTSGLKYNLGDPHPSSEIIKRYKELGGEIITVGSDAHKCHELCNYFEKAEEILKFVGFKYYTIFKDRKPEFIPL